MGLYTITTRAEGIVLTGAGSTSNIFNNDHVNHVTHTAAPFLNSWEATVAQMNLETNPANADGSASLPASLSDEIERLRYVLAQIKGFIGSGTHPHWYEKTGNFAAFVSFPTVACRIEQTVSQQIISGVESFVNFDSKLYDTLGTMATPPRITIPATGVYIIGAALGFGDGISQGPHNDFRLRLKSDTTVIAAENSYTGTTAGPKAISIATIAKLTVNSKLSLFVFQNDGTTKSPSTEADARPALWCAMIGRL